MSIEPGRRYRVAMVAACPFPANYGSPGAIREMCAALAELGHEVHVVTYPQGEDALPLGGVKLHRVGGGGGAVKVGPSAAKPLLDLKMIALLTRLVRREKIEIIHGHNCEGGLIAAAAGVLTGRPVVYHAVNLMKDELHTYRFIRPRIVADTLARGLDWLTPLAAREVIALTPELERALRAPGRRVTVVPLGVEARWFENPRPERIRERYNLGSRRVVMYTGVLSGFQRIDYLLRAYAVAREADTALMIVSPLAEEPERPALERLARELGIEPIWAGPHALDELADYLACADVAVVPRPDCPGHPVKLLNYMMAHRPIVCFEGGAKGVRHDVDAWVVPDHDWKALGKGISILLNDRERAARLGTRARQTVEENFDWRILCRTVEQVYARAVGQG